MSSDETLFNRRSVWGVSPQAVENLLAHHGRETQALRTRIAELESRVSVLTAQREEASRHVSGETSATQNRVLELEGRLTTALAQMKASEEELSLLRESADRISVLRKEAVQVVADAWAMSQAIEERTRKELQAEAAKVQAQLDDEKSRHRAEMERLGGQRVQMLMRLEATARGLLEYATLIKSSEATAEVASGLNAVLRSLGADVATASASAPAGPGGDLPPSSLPLPPLPPPTPAPPAALVMAPVAPPPQPVRAAELTPPLPLATNGSGAGAVPTEGVAALINALNELEALLSLPRGRWQGQGERQERRERGRRRG